MRIEGATLAAISAPSIGPSFMVVFGLEIPVAAFCLSLAGLLLSRYIAPKTTRRLNIKQELALTGLLALVLVIIVSGEFPYVGDGEPLGVGMAVAWGIGLGTSGLLAVELIGARVMAGLRAALGHPDEDRDSEGD